MSTLVTNTITGLSTAANITIGSTPVVSASATSLTIRGEGSNQTSVQQGLLKAWIAFDGTDTVAIDDSYNVSSITDNGTGQTTITFSVAMASTSYSWAGSTKSSADRTMVLVDDANTPAAASLHVDTVYDGATTIDCEIVAVQIAGDLA
tara:strand:+ start:339 stop:785 length:447 start_codon:yes stop_codon:yes gene_type:complete